MEVKTSQIKQRKFGDDVDLPPWFWDALKNAPRFPRINGIAQIKISRS